VPTEQAKGREAAKKKKVFVKSEEGWIGGCLDWNLEAEESFGSGRCQQKQTVINIIIR
jgi:hypothetical protein